MPLFLQMLREQTAASPERMAAAMAGLAAYQSAPRGPARRMAGVCFRRGRARLRGYGAPGNRPRRAIIVVPSLINPPFILDLTRETSLLRWLSSLGLNVFLLDWGTPAASARDLDVGAHAEQILVPLIKRFRETPIVVGYCLGGTIAAAAACLTPVAGLATIATPWRFDGFGAVARAQIAALWERARPLCDAIGLVPMEVLQSGFWRLDPARTIAKYEAFAAMAPTSDAAKSFVALEDWANAGAPLPYATGRQLFEDFVGRDLPGTGQWSVAGQLLDPTAIDCPTIDFVSLSDRIVPAATASGIANRHDLSAGHVGMIVGGRARDQLWQPLADWLTGIAGTK